MDQHTSVLRLLIAVSTSVAACSFVFAATPGEAAGQRQRIGSEIRAADQRLAAALAACADRFAATPCIDAARAEHRSVTEHLRREQQLLDAGERKNRAAARLARIEGKMNAQEAAASLSPAERAGRPAPQATPRPAKVVKAPRAPAPIRTPARDGASAASREADAAQRKARQQQRVQKMVAHQQALQQRQAERAKAHPPAAPLPAPPAASR